MATKINPFNLPDSIQPHKIATTLVYGRPEEDRAFPFQQYRVEFTFYIDTPTGETLIPTVTFFSDDPNTSLPDLIEQGLHEFVRQNREIASLLGESGYVSQE